MAKKVVMTLGVVFVLVGLLGFVNDPVLGLFEVDLWHNLVHLLSGVLALVFAMKGEEGAKMFAKVFGVVYTLVAVLGLLLPGDMLLGLIEVNLADDLLHVLLALVFLYVGFAKGKGAPSMPAQNPPMSSSGMDSHMHS